MAMTQNQLDSERDEYAAAHKEMESQDAQVAGLGDMVKRGASAVGKALLGDRTTHDATGVGRAYQIHLQESKATGESPMSREDFQKSLTTKA